MKRPAAAAVAPCKQQRSEPQRPEPTAAIAAALEKADLAENAKELLLAMLPSVMQPKPRHEFQDRVVEMLEAELSSIQKSLAALASEVAESMSNAETHKASLEKAVEDAEAHATSKAEAVQAAEAVLDAALSKLAEVTELQAQESASRLEIFAKVDSAAEKLELLAQTAAVKQGAVEGDSAAGDMLVSNLQLLVDDANFLFAATQSLKKQPDSRSHFESLVLQQLEDHLKSLEESWTTLKTEGAQQKELAEQKVAAAAAEVELQTASQKSAKEAVKEAIASKKEADKAVKAAKAAVKTFIDSIPRMQRNLDSAKTKLADFEGGALSEFQMLKDASVEEPKVGDEDCASPALAHEDSTKETSVQDEAASAVPESTGTKQGSEDAADSAPAQAS
jgi:DNA repair exonuclease SbcCD ATPase subunit